MFHGGDRINIIEAVKLTKNGKRVKLPWWVNDDYLYIKDNRVIVHFTVDREPTVEEVLSNEWTMEV